jgi:hypothetical protein
MFQPLANTGLRFLGTPDSMHVVKALQGSRGTALGLYLPISGMNASKSASDQIQSGAHIYPKLNDRFRRLDWLLTTEDGEIPLECGKVGN